MRIIASLLTICSLSLCVRTHGDESNCPNIHSAVQIAVIQKENLGKKLVDLEGKFKDLLERDIDAQADGVLDSFHRNEAKKVYFVKKQLTEAIKRKTDNITSMSEYFCKSCEKSTELSREEFCKTCSSSAQCGANDL